MEKSCYKVAVVTGANNGIGLTILKKLMEVGLKVVGFDIETENIEVENLNFGNKKNF